MEKINYSEDLSKNLKNDKFSNGIINEKNQFIGSSNLNLTKQIGKYQISPELVSQNEIIQINSNHLIQSSIIREQSKILTTSLYENFTAQQKPAELRCLINSGDLDKLIKEDPWQINIRKTIQDFQNRIYDNPEIKFRIGGRVIHSSSQIVRAKSNLVIQESQDTQDQILVNEIDDNDLDNFDDLDNYEDPEIVENGGNISCDDNFGLDSNLFDEILKSDSSREEQEINADLMRQMTTPHSFYSVDKNGERYLAAPVRKVFRKIDFSDLGKALNQAVRYQNRKPTKILQSLKGEVDVSSILPQNVLKKAEEERALVEEQINGMFQKISSLFQNNEPVSFLDLIISPNADGIVRSLLYLLHLVNRKKIELWQKMEELEDDPKTESERESHYNDENCLMGGIYISPLIF